METSLGVLTNKMPSKRLSFVYFF